MKKLFAFLSIAALCLTAISCVKEMEESTRLPEQGTRVSLTVNDADWVSTRSAYTPGEGIKLTKTEKIGLLYDNGSLLQGNGSYAIVASPQGGGSYSFTAPEAGLDKTWYAIVPYSKELTRARVNTDASFLLTFPSVQFPGQNTFDPATDILVAKPFTIDATGARTATIDAFKRLTAPFKLSITGLESGEKIYAVTIDLSKLSDGTDANMLAGRCVYTIGATPDDFGFGALQLTGTRSNALSAIYDEGLVEEGGCWPVWFNVRPSTIVANTKITVTVFTADACYTRQVPINAGTFATDRINTFSINIKGDGYTSAPAISQAFFNNGMSDATAINSAASEKTVALTATDGVERNWEMKGFNCTAAKMDGGSTLPNAVGFPQNQNSYVKIPAVAGKSITKIRLYLHSLSYVETNNYPLEVYSGETLVHTVTSVSMLDISRGFTRGGFIDLDTENIDGISDLTGVTLKFGNANRNAAAMVSRIVLFTGAAQAEEGDYYQSFLNGENIVIGNQTYNIADDDIKYALIETDVYEDFRHAVMNNDIVFVENSLTITNNQTAGIVLDRIRPLAIVGRYKNGKGQPFINMGNRFWQVHGGGIALLNVKMASLDHTHGLFTDGPGWDSATETGTYALVNNSLNIIDCTIESPQYLFHHKDNQFVATTSYIIDNSIIAITRTSNAASLFLVEPTQPVDKLLQFRKISVTNSVLYDRTPTVNSFRFFVTSVVPEGGGYGDYPNLEFVFKNNSVYNHAPRMVICASGTKSVVIDKNVMYGSYVGSDASICLFRTFSYPNGYTSLTYPTADNSSLSGNTLHFATSKTWVPCMGAEESWFTISGNSVAYDQATNTLFGTCDADKLYFPVNTSVVTNGGGATYDTKLWRTW